MIAATFFFFIYTRDGDRPVAILRPELQDAAHAQQRTRNWLGRIQHYGPRIPEHKGELANTQKPRDGWTPADAFAGTAAPGGEKVTGGQGGMVPLGE